jgi:hypothetical protein
MNYKDLHPPKKQKTKKKEKKKVACHVTCYKNKIKIITLVNKISSNPKWIIV